MKKCSFDATLAQYLTYKMKNIWYKIFLTFLRSLIYAKRAVVWFFYESVSLGRIFMSFYRKHLGFRVYKFSFWLKNQLRKANISVDDGITGFLGQRATLQAALFVVAVVIMIPHSKLYTKETQTIAGRGTLLYNLVGPGDLDFEIEEVEVDLTQLAQRDSRGWREGSVVAENYNGTDAIFIVNNDQELGSVSAGGSAVSKPTILPGTELPKPSSSDRSSVITHTVKPGDVIGRIAEEYGINVTTILWANNLSTRSYIRPGDELKILPVNGLLHTVKRGETVSKIARLYDAESEDIVKYNNLQEGGSDIVVGEELLVPGGEKPRPVYVAPTPSRSTSLSKISAPAPSVTAPAGSGYLWPTNVRRITQYYGWRHTGLDIAGPLGSPLYASRGGTVIKSQCGWNGGYGCYIIIDHGNGVQTLYAHASRLYVSVGDVVTQGQNIASMGSTGRSTGPHIHYEVRLNGRRQNPLSYIR